MADAYFCILNFISLLCKEEPDSIKCNKAVHTHTTDNSDFVYKFLSIIQNVQVMGVNNIFMPPLD